MARQRNFITTVGDNVRKPREKGPVNWINFASVPGKSNRQETENQAIQLRAWAEREGHEVIEYSDRMTGTKSERTAFLRMMDDAAERKFDMVTFWALDRFSREGREHPIVRSSRSAFKPLFQVLLHRARECDLCLDSYGLAWKSFTEQYL
jgi:hypothetical protein